MEASPEGLADRQVISGSYSTWSPQWRRAPKGSRTCDVGVVADRRSLPAMEASPEGLADCRRSGRSGPWRASRNGGEPRRARGHLYSPLALRARLSPQWRRAPKGSRTPRPAASRPMASMVPQWRRAPKGSRTGSTSRRPPGRPWSRNGGEPRRARGPTSAMSQLRTWPAPRNGGEPRRARGPDRDHHPGGRVDPPAMEASPEGLADLVMTAGG